MPSAPSGRALPQAKKTLPSAEPTGENAPASVPSAPRLPSALSHRRSGKSLWHFSPPASLQNEAAAKARKPAAAESRTARIDGIARAVLDSAAAGLRAFAAASF